MPSEKFTVDTHLFRELGELLVGRNSTALVELIKNAYDADATHVVIDGQDLNDPRRGVITVADNGTGMTPEQFKEGFLRIASRMREIGPRKSLRYARRFTGAKGIGRLAAHKLARNITITSVPDSRFSTNDSGMTEASIDWDVIESLGTLDEVENSRAVQLEAPRRPPKAASGTTIRLARLRRRWTPSELNQFYAEVGSFRPPEVLTKIPQSLIRGDLLFDAPTIADATTLDPGIRFDLTGDFSAGDDYWPAVADAAHWLVEIDAGPRRKKVAISVCPTKRGRSDFPDAKQHRYSVDHPNLETGPFFQARILIREGGGGDRAFNQWLGRSYGVRVYMEGFRVLPYGEPNNDWLSLDADYKSRPRTLSLLNELGLQSTQGDKDEGLQFLGNRSYFGGVFLTTSRTPGLRMLINREGFVPDAALDALVELLRTSIYLSVRVRAAAKHESRQKWRDERSQPPGTVAIRSQSRMNLRQAVTVSVTKAAELAKEARALASTGNYGAAKEKIDQAAREFTRGSEVSDRLMTEGNILRVLASVGTQMAAFVHEINSMLGMAAALEQAVGGIERDADLPAQQRRKLAQLRSAVGDLRRGIERQASYLTDVVSPDARRRRSRQRLSERFDVACRLVESVAARRAIDITNQIPADLKSPPMFPAELAVVFSNLLTNAAKAAGDGGRVRATGGSGTEGGSVVRLENTGVEVDLADSERWFRPFQSTTVETDPVLGQGMGMGLPITRNLLEEYGATIQFVKPSRGYSTAIEVRLPT
jgi:signal transduction histidine kinase